MSALSITPALKQDNSLLSPSVTADILIHRSAGAVALNTGEEVDGIRLSV